MSEPPIVIGHSFGSLIALELAARGTPVRGIGMMNCGVSSIESKTDLDATTGGRLRRTPLRASRV